MQTRRFPEFWPFEIWCRTELGFFSMKRVAFRAIRWGTVLTTVCTSSAASKCRRSLVMASQRVIRRLGGAVGASTCSIGRIRSRAQVSGILGAYLQPSNPISLSNVPLTGQYMLPVGRGLATTTACCNQPGCSHQQEVMLHALPQKKEAGCGTDHDHANPCWACGKLTGCCNFFCTCGKIQPVVGHCSYFETFHLPKRYDIDPRQLERSYWGLQKDMHPDRYGQKSRTEQDLSNMNSTYLNVAYKTLKDPTLRAKYLLQLEGINALDEASKSADPVLLMEIMELRESIESATSPEDMRDLLKSNRQAIEELQQALADHYKAQDFEAMLDLTTRLQYLTKVSYEARERLDRLEDTQHATSA